jgi:hypothetical protein
VIDAALELGCYRLDQRIGEGGGGQVYRASGPGGPVAIKILGPASDLDDAVRVRLEREIATLQQLAHPNLITLLDHGVDPELGPYLVLPLLAGTNLRGLTAGRATSPEAALLLIQPVVRAVAALHAAGFVHRDLKPENAVAAPDGAITLIDLGLVWADGMSHHTDTGAAVGSVGYMSPEQIEGRAVDARADVWAVGVMLYELVTGKRPFARPRAAEEAAAALLGTCPKLTAADRRAGEELADVVARCLAVDPAKRPTAAELERTIADLIDWTDDADAERAVAVADPVGYQARVATFRVRRLARLAREALDAGKPFAALGSCDRGLAYQPDDPELLALVVAAETATSKPRPALTATGTLCGAVPASPSVTAPPRRSPRWAWWILGGALVAGATVIAIVGPNDAPDDPWAAPRSNIEAPAKLIPDERDRKLIGNFVDVFGRVVERPAGSGSGKGPMTEQDRALARDVVHLFGQFIERAER